MPLVSDLLFVGNGEMATLMRGHDWSQTSLGSVETWPSSLRTTLSICLNSRFPMVIWWGKELVLLYNDAWRPILDTKHPQSLGRPGEQVGAELWEIVGTQLHSVLETGQATCSEDRLLLVDRSGCREEAYFTYSHSPIFLETGEVGGVFTAVTETTQRVMESALIAADSNLAPTLNGKSAASVVTAPPIDSQSSTPVHILLAIASRQEQQLRLEAQTARENLDRVVASINDQFFTLNHEWRYSYVNDRVVQILGLEREALLGQNIWELFPKTIGSQFELELGRAMAEQTAVHFEYFYPDWNRWFDNHAYPDPGGLVLFVTEITDRKHAETALQRSEEKFRDMADHSPVMIWVTDPTGYCTFLSQSWYEFSGQTEATGLGFGWLDAVHPDDYAQAKETFLAANQRQEEFWVEYRLRNQAGEYRWAIDTATPWRGAEGEYKGYIGSVIDITDRRQAEIALRNSEERFRTLSDNIAQLAWMTDAQGGIVWYNQRWFNYTGTTMAEMAGWGWQRVHHPDHVERVVEKFRSCLELGQTWEDTFPLRGKDGQYRWFLSRAVPIHDAQGQVLRWFGTNTDITDLRQVEQERERLLVQEQAARTEAERANRIKDEFLAVLSHELRSPLNPILGWTKLLLTRKFDDQATKRALETIERNAKLQTQLIEDLLDVSRILQGKMALNIARIDLRTTIESALETVRLSANAKGISIQEHLAINVGAVSGDSMRLQQVFWNLLSNAVKFTPTGGRIEVWLEPGDRCAQVRVTDTGKGIHAEFLPHVFEYFRQEDGQITRQFGGLGLGLAIVRHLLELHGGTIEVTSPGEGLGTTFTVYLPLLAKLESLELSASLPVPLNPENSTPLAGLQILVVDDEADMRDLMVTILEQYGAQPRAASSAKDALNLMQQTRPQMLISDIGMPEMDGYMLMRQVRNQLLEPGESIPAIALTAYASELDQKQAISAGFQLHIAKPAEPEALVKAILSLVSQSGLR